jgi:hypothetical protein
MTLASEYPGFLDARQDLSYSDFLKEHHPWTPDSQAIATYDADSVRSATERPRDDWDEPAPQDFVDIGPEVDAFAYLLTARALVPPLAVGLFGDWGSGKSFFMQALQRRIDRITEAARRSGKPQRDLPIHKSVVQIQFNAWHYVEGNLWASLVDHIFSNLRSSPRDRPGLLEERRRHVTEKISSAELARDRVGLEVKAEQVRLDAATAERLRLEKEQLDKRAALDAQAKAAADIVKEELSENVTAVLDQLGYSTAASSVADLADAIAAARAGLRRGTGLVGRFQHGGPGWVAAILVVVAIGPIASYVLARADVPLVTNALGSVATVLGGLTLLLKRGTEWTNEQLKTLEDAEQKILDQQRMLDQATLEANQQLESIEADLRAKRDEEQTAAARVRELERELASITPAKVLSDFIDARVGSDDYRKHLGLTALVRRDFEDLWQLVTREEARFVETDTGKDLEAPTEIGRIVLYVDDLDRCPPRVVVNVLQAIHLLLAFPLFVVVVAVDARWLSSSLEKHYGELLGRPRLGGLPGASRSGREADDQATPDDYLEKIFQIPFWVRRLDQSSRARIIQGLVGPSLASTEPTVSGSNSAEQATTDEADEAAFSDLVRRFVDRDGGEPSLSPRSLEITPRELRFMHGLAGLLGDTPRAVKRFVNAYRLMKSLAERRDPNFTADAPFAGYQVVLLLLAVVTGMPEISPALFRRIETPDSEEATLGKFAERLSHSRPDGATRLMSWLDAPPNTEWTTLQMTQLASWSDDIARFSFRTEVA